jgi:hypothetical protein
MRPREAEGIITRSLKRGNSFILKTRAIGSMPSASSTTYYKEIL